MMPSLKVGPYIFVPLLKRKADGCLEEVPNTYAIPGRTQATKEQIVLWAMDNCFFIKEI